MYTLIIQIKAYFVNYKSEKGCRILQLVDIIRKNGCTDTVIVVTRYFGGTLLGTGGLVHAYTSSALGALKEAKIIKYDIYSYIEIKTSYSDYGKITAPLNELGFRVEDTDYGVDVTVSGSILKENLDTLKNIITEVTSGRASIDLIGEEFSC